MDRNDHKSLYKNIYFYSFVRGWSFCSVLDRWTEGDKTDLENLLYWPITFHDHSTLCYLQNPTWHFCFSAGVAQPVVWYGLQTPAERSQWLQAGSDSELTDSNWLTCGGHLHILFHNAHLLPIRSHNILPIIYADASLIVGLVKAQYVTIGPW